MKKRYIRPILYSQSVAEQCLFPALAAAATAASATFGLVAARKLVRATPGEKKCACLEPVVK